MENWGKRGITPLMGAFLLISFAVAVGVVIMNFGRAQVEEQAQCPIDIGLRFSMIGNEEQFCYDAAKKEIKFTVENGVNINVEGLVINTIGTEKAETLELNEARMGKAGNYLGRVSYDTAVSGTVRQVKISPKVKLYDEELICQEKAIMKEKVRGC